MKVLFAVNNENISESIIKKYQQEYKEIISVKNVYYFNAIIKELQRDKTYDRIVISEDLQPFSNNNYDSVDKFIFEKMDNISDEATNQSGNDIPIILICTDRRTKSEPILIKLFGIGLYNALIGKDRSITNVCELLAKPRTKKEAKAYYRIDSDDVNYKVENEGDVSEIEIQNILNHYKKLGNDEQKYVESFDHIANQYTDSQLRLIAKFLPLNVKAVLEANSMKYQEVILFGAQTAKQQNYQPPSVSKIKNEKQKNEPKKDEIKLELIEKNLSKNRMKEPVVIPSAINTAKVRKMQEQILQGQQIENQKETVKTEIEQIQAIDDILENVPKKEEHIVEPVIESVEEHVSEAETLQNLEETQIESIEPKRRGRPKKIQSSDPIEEKTKRGRGRPKKIVDSEISEEGDVSALEEVSAPVNLFELGDEKTPVKTTAPKKEDDMFLPGLDDETLFAERIADQRMPIIDKSTPEYKNKNIIQEDIISQEPIIEQKIIESNEIEEISEPFLQYDGQVHNIVDSLVEIEDQIQNEEIQQNKVENINNNYNTTDLNGLLTRDKKIVAFVGTSKNGTSFLVNNIAEIMSQKGINTAILDLTKNKNAYYIYTENEENLRKTAYNCIADLRRGNATGIQVHKNLTVYTTLPVENEDFSDYTNILQTLSQNYSLVLLDCDFDTYYHYFEEVQELYLVQSLDVLTIQPLTAFLRNLKAKNALNPEKIRIVLNKVVKLRSITEKTIIGGMAFYNDPAMSFMTELFNKDTVTYCTIPFEEQAYSKYLEGLVNCKITLNGYSKNFMTVLNKLGDMVYPLVNNSNIKNKGNNYNNYKNANYNKYNNNNFPSNMNDTLNKMKNNY